MLCNEIKICKRAASTHARDGEREREGGREGERHYFRLKRDAMFSLSLSLLLFDVVVSVVSQTEE